MRRFRRMVLIARLCAEYHSGQWSRGYRLLCRVLAWFRRRGVVDVLEWPLLKGEARFYRKMVDRYAFAL